MRVRSPQGCHSCLISTILTSRRLEPLLRLTRYLTHSYRSGRATCIGPPCSLLANAIIPRDTLAKIIQFCLPLFPRHNAFSSEGGHQGRFSRTWCRASGLLHPPPSPNPQLKLLVRETPR